MHATLICGVNHTQTSQESNQFEICVSLDSEPMCTYDNPETELRTLHTLCEGIPGLTTSCIPQDINAVR